MIDPKAMEAAREPTEEELAALGDVIELNDSLVDNGRELERAIWDFVARALLAGEGNSVAAGAAPFDPDTSRPPASGVAGLLDIIGKRGGRIRTLELAKDEAYLERNRVVAALASLFPSGVAHTDIPGWLPEWHGCVYIDLPTGQASWHFHDSHAFLFDHLPAYTKLWDGHTTEAKYDRLAALAAANATGEKAGVTQASDSLARPSSSPSPAVRDAPYDQKAIDILREEVSRLLSRNAELLSAVKRLAKDYREFGFDAEDYIGLSLADAVIAKEEVASSPPAVRDVTLREALEKIQQRCNESGAGEMGLLDTIHAVHAIAVAALSHPSLADGGKP